MSAATAIPIPEELFREVSQHADHTGVPTQEWVAKVLAEHVRVERQTEAFFRLRAAGASAKTLGELLDKSPMPRPTPETNSSRSIARKMVSFHAEPMGDSL